MKTSSQEVCEALMGLIERVKLAVSDISETHHLTHVQVFALHVISSCGGVNMGQVAHKLHCDPSNVTGIVDRLVQQGMITRQESAHDRRTKIIVLTAKGEHVLEDVRKALPTYLGCSKLSTNELTHLYALLQKMQQLEA